MTAEVRELKRQIAEGELIHIETLLEFLESKCDRWNPLYVDALQEFAKRKSASDSRVEPIVHDGVSYPL